MATNHFEDNSSLYNVNLNRFTRPQEPTLDKRIQKASLRLAVLNELAYKGANSSYSDGAAMHAYTTLADELMEEAGYVNEHGQLQFEVQSDGSAIIRKAVQR